MTRTQYNAMMEVSNNAEHVAPEFLNIRPQTERALLRQKWIERLGKGYVWTERGANAVAAI